MRIAIFAGIPFVLLGLLSIIVNTYSSNTNPHVSGMGIIVFSIGIGIIIDGANGQNLALKGKEIVKKIFFNK